MSLPPAPLIYVITFKKALAICRSFLDEVVIFLILSVLPRAAMEAACSLSLITSLVGTSRLVFNKDWKEREKLKIWDIFVVIIQLRNSWYRYRLRHRSIFHFLVWQLYLSVLYTFEFTKLVRYCHNRNNNHRYDLTGVGVDTKIALHTTNHSRKLWPESYNTA